MTRIETIRSAANPLIKDVRRAIARGGLTSDGLCIGKSFHLLEEALRSDRAVHVVLASESVRATVERHVSNLHGPRILVLPDALFQTVAGSDATQGVIALIEQPQWTLEQLFRGQSLVIVLDGVQDPGNAGAIARAAEAFSATGIIFVKGTVNPWNPNALRASAGSLFRVPVAAGLDSALTRAALQQHRLDVYAAMPFTGSETLPEDIDLSRRCAIVFGAEARGVGAEFRTISQMLAIPTSGVESLNVAMAASILLYEARCQRVREAVRA
jgi:TrmH family RNA methyltransferase